MFFAGLPGTGKSLLVHQLTHLALSAGRRVHLLQWDVARPAFEASPAGQRYPMVAGVTHALIRKAAGLWVRQAVADWHDRHSGTEHLLVGETPFVGGRFIELARRLDDRAEPLLASPSCRFALAVPSREVRRHLEAERERRSANPAHPREREDALPPVLRDLWRQLAAVGRRLGLAASDAEYDPDVYRRMFTSVLRHRHADVVDLDVILPTERFSVYDVEADALNLVPSDTDAGAFIVAAERACGDPAVLERETARWWEV